MSFGFGIGDIITLSSLANKVRKRFVDSPDQFRAIFDEVKSLSNIIRDLEDVFPDREDSLSDQQKVDLKDFTQGCATVLGGLDGIIDKYHVLDTGATGLKGRSKKLWRRLKWEPDDIRELRSRITSNIALLTAFNGNLTVKYVVRLNRNQDDAERRTITNWLSPIDFATLQSDYINRCQKGTGQWLLGSKEYKTWVNEPGQTLFCPGIPGAGKTMIASIVIDDLWKISGAEADVGVAFLFCSYKRHQEQKVSDLKACLLKQLVQGRDVIPDEVKSLHRRHADRGTRPSTDEISSILRLVASSYSKISIVVDTLDECPSIERQQLMKELFKIQTTAHANLLATSRFLPDVVAQFSEAKSLEIRASKEDVERYLDNQLLLLPSFVLKNTALQQEIVIGITNAIDGMFLLAQLHLDSLKYKTTVKAVKTAIQNLRKGSEALDIAYSEATDRIKAQPNEHLELARKVLSWITYSKRQLSVRELQHALAVEAGERELDKDNIPEEEDMVSACAGLVTIDQESNVIRLVHYTTQEYLERIRSSWLFDGQTYISISCLTYLSFNVFTIGYCTSDKQLEALLLDNIFLDYATYFWGSHTREASKEVVKPFVERFLGSASNVCCSYQVLTAPYDIYPFYSQEPSKQIPSAHLVAYFGLDEMMPGLFRAGHHPNSRDKSGWTPLFYAARYGHERVVELLVKRDDVKADLKDLIRRTPLPYAARHGHKRVVELLVTRDDGTADSKDLFHRTPLSYAAQHGHERIVELLVKRDDVKADRKDYYGRTPLSYAAQYGHERVVELLVERNDVVADLKDKSDWTPLHYAIKYRHEATVKLLAARNDVKVDMKEIDRRNLILRRYWRPDNIVLKWLIKENAEENSEKQNGETAEDSATSDT